MAHLSSRADASGTQVLVTRCRLVCHHKTIYALPLSTMDSFNVNEVPDTIKNDEYQPVHFYPTQQLIKLADQPNLAKHEQDLIKWATRLELESMTLKAQMDDVRSVLADLAKETVGIKRDVRRLTGARPTDRKRRVTTASETLLREIWQGSGGNAMSTRKEASSAELSTRCHSRSTQLERKPSRNQPPDDSEIPPPFSYCLQNKMEGVISREGEWFKAPILDNPKDAAHIKSLVGHQSSMDGWILIAKLGERTYARFPCAVLAHVAEEKVRNYATEYKFPGLDVELDFHCGLIKRRKRRQTKDV
ncbi:hypothetical protein DICA4_A04082 [Diutina catenulata]